MKVLITGAAGQLGRALVASAPAKAEVVGVDLVDFDVGDAEATAAAIDQIRPDLIVNAAAYTAVDRAEGDAEAAYRINRDAVQWLAEGATRVGARLVHVSTDFVFDGKASQPYRIGDPTSPLSVYGASKRAGEIEALTSENAIVVRTAWLYSAGGANFARTMLKLFNDRPVVRVVADQMGTPTHANSLAGAIWRLADAQASGIHHFTDAGAASWYDFAVAIKEEGAAQGLCPGGIAIEPIRTQDYPTPAHRPAYSVLDKTTTWSVTGGPARHWREPLRDMMIEVRDHG